MRVYVLMLMILFLAFYAFRDWFIPLCGLIVLSAIMKHDDVPRTILGIQGANPWNFLFVFVLLGWAVDRYKRGITWDVTRPMAALVISYAAVIAFAFARGAADVGRIRHVPGAENIDGLLGFTSDFLINPLKYLAVAVLLYDGARTRRNAFFALGAITLQAYIYALQVMKYVPPWLLLSSEGSKFRFRIVRECGLHPNDMALVMVIGFWTIVACIPLLRRMRVWWKLGAAGVAAAIFTALLLCYSRGGYVGFVAVGLLFGVLVWRPLLAIFPLTGLAVCIALPGVVARMSEGFDVTSASGEQVEDWDAVSAGRMTNIWPATLDSIQSSPIAGRGRLTILRTDLYDRIFAQEGNVPTHPHNAYLEMALDSGLVGLAITLGIFAGLPLMALLRGKPSDPLLLGMWTAGLAAACTMLVMAMSGQTFFPREGIFLVLCSYAVLMRAERAMRDAPAPARPATSAATRGGRYGRLATGNNAAS
jgi:O-antigen ligase